MESCASPRSALSSLIFVLLLPGLAGAQVSLSPRDLELDVRLSQPLPGIDGVKTPLPQGSSQFPQLPKLSDLESILPAGEILLGPGEGGGGDPMAQQFISMSKRLALFFKANPDKARLPFSSVEFQTLVDQLDESIKNESLTDRIAFTDQRLADQNGVTKAAFFDRKTMSITIHRPFWRSATADERLTLVTMEILGLLGIKENRYQVAANLIRDRVAAIMAIPLPQEESFKMSGWRIVGQNPEQFAQLSDDDVIIDPGPLGSDDRINRRLDRFLENPASDPEWFAKLQKAETNRRPAYLLLANFRLQRAGVIALYKARFGDGIPGVIAYWLRAVKIREVYDGPCVGDARSLSPAERIRSCLLDQRNYVHYDFMNSRKVGDAAESSTQEALLPLLTRDIKESLLHFFALDISALQEALRANFIVDYTPLILDPNRTDPIAKGYRLKILGDSIRAHGFKPSLVGPFGDVAFLAQTSEKSISSVRFFKALEMLASKRLGFIEHAFTCGSIKGPALQDLQTLKQDRASGRCLDEAVTNFPPLASQLLTVMLREGYFYDTKNEAWLQGQAPTGQAVTVPDSESPATELQVRYLTERLRSDTRYQLLTESLAQASPAERLEIYHWHLRNVQTHGFSQTQIDKLFEQAFKEVLNAPVWMSLAHSGPHVNFRVSALRAALNGRPMNAEIAANFLREAPKQPWFRQPELAEALWSFEEGRLSISDKDFVAFLLSALSQPHVREHSESTVVASLTRTELCTENGCEKPRTLSFSDRLELLMSLKIDVPAPRLQVLKAGTLFESLVAKSPSKDEKAQAAILESILSTRNQSLFAVEIAAQWMVRNKPTLATRDSIVKKILEVTQSASYLSLEKSDALGTLIRLPRQIRLSPNSQESIFTFVIASTTKAGLAGAQTRKSLILILFQTKNQPTWRIAGIQKSLVLLTRSLNEFDQISDIIGDKIEQKHSTVNRLMDLVHSCRQPDLNWGVRVPLCDEITEPQAIFKAIAENPRLADKHRQRARNLLQQYN